MSNLMNPKKYDITIILRTYEGTKPSKTRALYPDDKYKLVELCLSSLIHSLGKLKAKFIAILDNCSKKWEDLFRNYVEDNDLQIINLNSAGEIGSYELAIKLLLSQDFSEIIYMAEDDYFYLPLQFEKMVNLLIKDHDVDFVSSYDHLDNYTSEFHDYKSKIKIFQGKHWRNLSTTCSTFLTTKSTLYKTSHIFLKNSPKKQKILGLISRKNKYLNKYIGHFFSNPVDNNKWLSLTKINVFQIFKIIKLRFQSRQNYEIYFRAWRYHWRQILFGKKWNLWCPIPSIATHMEENYLAPTINWKLAFQNGTNKLIKRS